MVAGAVHEEGREVMNDYETRFWQNESREYNEERAMHRCPICGETMHGWQRADHADLHERMGVKDREDFDALRALLEGELNAGRSLGDALETLTTPKGR
jgi:hypothetical protein